MSKGELRSMKVSTFGCTQRGEKDRGEGSGEEIFMDKVHLNKGELAGGL